MPTVFPTKINYHNNIKHKLFQALQLKFSIPNSGNMRLRLILLRKLIIKILFGIQ